MSRCPGLHCPGCRGGVGRVLAIIVAVVVVLELAERAIARVWWLLAITAVAFAIAAYVVWRLFRWAERRDAVRGGQLYAGRLTSSPVRQLAADRQARYASYRDTARRGTFGPAGHLGLCTLTDTLEVLGLPVDELERRALARLAAGDPLIVAVVDDLLNRAARNDYDPVRYAVPGPPARHLRAITDKPSTRKDSDR